MRKILLLLALTCAGAAQARITDLGQQKVEPFAEGAQFGAAGAYERVSGVAKGELDPADVRNRVIVNLQRAPKNARGLVEYEVDWFMLRPADASKGNGKIIYDVTNRGRKFIHWRLMDAKTTSTAAANDPKTPADAGNGVFFRMGYTLAWSGWDSEAPRAGNGMAMNPIIATDLGKPIVRVIRDELVSGTRSRADPVADGAATRELFPLSYAAATLDPAQARLTVRRGEADARREIPAGGWAYAGATRIDGPAYDAYRTIHGGGDSGHPAAILKLQPVHRAVRLTGLVLQARGQRLKPPASTSPPARPGWPQCRPARRA